MAMKIVGFGIGYRISGVMKLYLEKTNFWKIICIEAYFDVFFFGKFPNFLIGFWILKRLNRFMGLL